MLDAGVGQLCLNGFAGSMFFVPDLRVCVKVVTNLNQPLELPVIEVPFGLRVSVGHRFSVAVTKTPSRFLGSMINLRPPIVGHAADRGSCRTSCRLGLLAKGRQTDRNPSFIEHREGRWVVVEESRQLAHRDLEDLGGTGDIPPSGHDHIEGLCEQGGIVTMFWIHRHSIALSA